ncbi:phosphotransferase family protein [Novosphingobium sp. BL-52-GroH]|uniref:phosphotransferase family protein n=1 Tax=Novosphingobium sp. BL-52-GroH TaxID=3349877 RepID=UPI00384EE430
MAETMHHSFDIRQNPDAHFLAQVRARFPVEAEIDRTLSRKMTQRATGRAYAAHSLESLVAGTANLVRANVGDDFAITNARWLTGGASKIQVAFDLDWHDGNVRRSEPMVLRMEPAESVVETSRKREFELLQALDGVVPVPPCFWVDDTAEHLPHPALIYGFAQGVTKPSDLPSQQVTGIGLNYGPRLRAPITAQFIEHMARFHRMGAELAPRLPSFDRVEVGSNASVIRLVNWWRRVWEEDRAQDEPLMTVAYDWLIANAPPIDHVSLVHGDCRAGNFLFNESDARITAWLDWELALLGDRHQDLAWSMMDPYRHSSEDGSVELINGMLPYDDYIAAYEKASGLVVDPARLAYYRVLCSYLSVSICLGTGYRVAKGAKTHQDIVVGWLAMISYPIMEQLRSTLQEAL